MRPDPRQGVIPREHRDGVRDAPPPPQPIVLIDPDPDVTSSRWGLAGELLRCVRASVASPLGVALGAAVLIALGMLAMYSLPLLSVLLLAAAFVVVALVESEGGRDADPKLLPLPQWGFTLLRMALAAALLVAIVLARLMLA